MFLSCSNTWRMCHYAVLFFSYYYYCYYEYLEQNNPTRHSHLIYRHSLDAIEI